MSDELDEFALIRSCFEPIQATDPASCGIVLGIGDDAAVLELPAGQQLVLSVDTLVAGVHFPEHANAADIGWRALAVNLSDLAAMGADSRWFTLSLCMPKIDPAWITEFCSGLKACAERDGIALVGGDTVQGPLCITVQVAGSVPAGSAIPRCGARPGDVILVSGTLGDAAGGLEISRAGLRPELSADMAEYLLNRFNRPTPRTGLRGILRDHAHAAIDVSDGLAADLGHVLDASGVGASIELNRLPLSDALESIFGAAEARRMALGGGDDYELCFTVAEEEAEKAIDLGAASGMPITRIGRIEPGSGLRCLDENGATVAVGETGYRHFRNP